MDDTVDPTVKRRLKGALEMGKKIRTSSSTLNPGAPREIKAQVGVGRQ